MDTGTVERDVQMPPGGLPYIALAKTAPPSAYKVRVERSRLLELLRDAATRRLILLKAPAGYGKTTLAVDWYEHLRRSGAIVAWLSVDEDDNEPSAFAYHIARTLHRAAPELGQSAIDLLTEANLIASRSVASATMNAAAESDDEIYLFLDDYHLITDVGSHEITTRFLRYAPSNFHLVIMSRTEPPLAISRLRLTDEVVEIDMASLRFTIEETRQFLRSDLAPRLEDGDIQTLYDATEGWPAALQLARITVRNSPDLGHTIRAFSGASRKISAYIEDTLATQADEIVEFLMQTAVLDRLHGPLCQAVTGIARSAEFLKALEHEQLLLVTLDEHNGWYRYHHLMSDFLLDRLHTRMPDRIPELHRRAHGWYAAQGMWTHAVQHAIAARDFDQALRYVEQCAMAMVAHGDLLTLVSWERNLPAELMGAQLEVKLALAWSFFLVTRLAEGGALLAQVEEVADQAGTPDLWWRCQVARAAFVALSDDSDRGLVLATECQGKIAFDPFYRNAIFNVIRYGTWKAADFGAFYALPKPDISDGEVTNLLAEQYRLCLYGLAAAQRLHTGEALALFTEARQLIEKHATGKPAAAAIPTGPTAALRYEIGDIADAEIAVLDELELVETIVFHEGFLAGYLVLARAAFVRDDLGRALKALERGIQLAQERGWYRLVAEFLLERARFVARDATPAELQRIADQVAAIEAANRVRMLCSWSSIETATIICRGIVALASADAGTAARLLQQAYDRMLRIDDRRGALRVGMDLAIAYHRGGNAGEANAITSEIVGFAARSGALSFALERRTEFAAVLTLFLKSAIDPALRSCAEMLLARSRYRKLSANESRASGAAKQLLTERERSIIRFIADGQSNKQIARTLGVTPETIKTRVKRIFIKLSAESRAQAVVRAQSLGLLRDIEVN